MKKDHKPTAWLSRLSRREREVMDIVYAREKVTASDLQEALTLSSSAVRTFLRILEKKEFLTHTEEQGKFIYRPVVPREKAAKSALQQLLDTFFAGSAEQAVAALLDAKSSSLSAHEYERIEALIKQAKSEGR